MLFTLFCLVFIIGSEALAAPAVPGFTLSPSSSSLTLAIGYNNPIDIVVADLNGFKGKVSLAASGVPAGVTAAFASVNTSTIGLTFTRSTTAAAGTYSVTLTGTSGTVSSQTTITIIILQPSFTLSSSASDLTLLVGGASAGTSISIAGQNGFSSAVSFAVSGVPSGVTATFSSPSTTSKSTLTLTPSSMADPGTCTLTVTGTSGILVSTTTIALTIPEPGFSISSSESALTLLVGGATVSSIIDVASSKGSAASVALTATGPPKGVTASFSQATTTKTSLLTLAASTSAVPGSYTVIVTGTFGAVTSSATIALSIPVPGFNLSPETSTLTVLAGGASESRLIGVMGINGFSGSVALTATGLPAGVTAIFSPAITGTTSTLTFAASSAAVAGTYTVTVTGTSGTAQSTATVVLTIPGPISIAITQPTYGFNVLPDSVRRIYATVTNGLTNAVNWSQTGGASLSSSSGNWIDVTAPPTGSSCSINGTENYTVTSAMQFTLTAQSQENPAKTTSITVNVCNPAVQVQVVPFYTTLYSEQKADIQAFVWGAVNRNVTWAITAEPNGGDGALADAVNQDTVFSASVAGRYTLTATSMADGTKTNMATVFVTGNSMPYDVTPSETMPVDCTVDPALTGTTYDVGPSQKYKTISSVPWSSLTAGTTVRIHNEDTTGGDPTTYHEYFLLTGQGTRTQPIRVCGVPDSRGNLPVIDASDSTTSLSYPTNLVGYGAVTVGKGGWAGVYTGTWTGPQDLIVEGLKIQNAEGPNTFTSPSGVPGTQWVKGAACVRLFQSVDAVVRGIDASSCNNGIFSDFNANNGYAVVTNTLYEGNHVHGNGELGSDSYHQFYIQGWNEVVQFNIVDQYQSGAEGSNFKGRGFPEILRYNHFGDGAARQLDMVDNQDARPYTTFEGYIGEYHSIYPKDTYTADRLAAAVESHHGDYVYGNTFVNTTAGVPIHYSTDHGSLEDDRIGTLWFYNNSFYEPTCNGCPNWRWYMFDTSGGGGDDFREIEWPQIQADNNAIWMDAPTKPYFYWNRETNEFTTFGKNAINSNWGTDSMSGGDGTGWATASSAHAFQGASNSADTAGPANLIGASTEPFDVTTFAPNPALVNTGAPLPASWPKLPVRFQYAPSAIQTVREQPLTIGAME